MDDASFAVLVIMMALQCIVLFRIAWNQDNQDNAVRNEVGVPSHSPQASAQPPPTEEEDLERGEQTPPSVPTEPTTTVIDVFHIGPVLVGVADCLPVVDLVRVSGCAKWVHQCFGTVQVPVRWQLLDVARLYDVVNPMVVTHDVWPRDSKGEIDWEFEGDCERVTVAYDDDTFEMRVRMGRRSPSGIRMGMLEFGRFHNPMCYFADLEEVARHAACCDYADFDVADMCTETRALLSRAVMVDNKLMLWATPDRIGYVRGAKTGMMFWHLLW